MYIMFMCSLYCICNGSHAYVKLQWWDVQMAGLSLTSDPIMLAFKNEDVGF